MRFTFWDISESVSFAWYINSLLFRCEAACPISISTACLRKTFLRIQPHDFSLRMFTSKTSLTSEYCKKAKCPGMPKLRWSTAVAEFWYCSLQPAPSEACLRRWIITFINRLVLKWFKASTEQHKYSAWWRNQIMHYSRRTNLGFGCFFSQ